MDVRNRKNDEVSVFQMPLHYPRYSKEDYQVMPEWKLDRVLADYGLSTYGDLAHKRDFYDFQVQSFVWNKSLGMMSHDFCVCFMQHVGLDLVT
ncbi:unnamed protein product, partial [Brassica rapa subsp. trilocularis]